MNIRDYKGEETYLTETLLGELLLQIFPTHTFRHNKTIPGSNIRHRPDYYYPELNLIIEFDGYQHYTNPKVILNDKHKDTTYSAMGVKTIRIPYFIQLTEHVVEHFFGVKGFVPNYSFPHGFVAKKAITPAFYCEMGLKRLDNEMSEISAFDLDMDIYRSYAYRVNTLSENPFTVMPLKLVDSLISHEQLHHSNEKWEMVHPT